MSSNFQDKMSQIKKTIIANSIKESQNNHHKMNHACSNVQIRLDESGSKKTMKDQLYIQQPIIIQKKETPQSRPSSGRKQSTKELNISNTTKNRTLVNQKKQIQAFKPIQIPIFEKRIDAKTMNCFSTEPSCNNKEIQIKIQKDETKDKQCLKKLFKKIHKLTQQLAAAQKQNMQLRVELQNYKNVSKTCANHDKIINQLQGQKYKFEIELNMLKKLMQDRDNQIKRLSSHVAKQIIKQVVIQKPVQVPIQVPKLVPGPERIVEKIVEVPKYIQVEKKVPIQTNYQPREIIKTVQVPKIVQKPVYIDKPIYIDRPVQKVVQKIVEVPIEVPPIQVPIYIDRPVISEEYEIKVRHLQSQLEDLIKANDMLCHENTQLRFSLQKLTANLEILSRHNHQKNRETEILMQNSFDYYPISPGVDLSTGSVRYSVSTHPHPRVI